MRRSEEVVCFVVEYVGYASGPFTPQLTLRNQEGETNEYGTTGGFAIGFKGGLLIHTLPEIGSPDCGDDYGVPGNVFQICGFPYWVEKDRRRVLRPRFDLLTWQPIPPYRTWNFGPETIEHTDLSAFNLEQSTNSVANAASLRSGAFLPCTEYK
jgi:hypothetical protein